MTKTRRLAAILAIDVVGYSRLMGEDEARPRRRSASIGTRRGVWPTDAAVANGSFPPIAAIPDQHPGLAVCPGPPSTRARSGSEYGCRGLAAEPWPTAIRGGVSRQRNRRRGAADMTKGPLDGSCA